MTRVCVTNEKKKQENDERRNIYQGSKTEIGVQCVIVCEVV